MPVEVKNAGHTKSVSITFLFPNERERGRRLSSEAKKGYTRRMRCHNERLKIFSREFYFLDRIRYPKGTIQDENISLMAVEF